jgi:hypothetical protein
MDPVLGYVRATVAVRCMSDHSLKIKSESSCAAQVSDNETHCCRIRSAVKRIIVSLVTKLAMCKLGACAHAGADRDCIITNKCHGV